MNLDRIGKYRVVGKIGKGAMGEVYKAHDPLLNRYVALKTIASSLASDSEFKKRFQREAQSAAQLNHPNIITVYDFGEEQGFTFMAMELLEGVDLREAIRAGALGHLGRKLEVMAQIAEGLAFAHSRGVIHRDLKPGNIHLQPSGHVKILDFGLARAGASDMTKTGTVMGTPHYMSPEQVRGQKADARSDVFSLGAVFYEMLCHHRPFEADSVHTVLLQILEQPPEPMRKWEPDLPASVVGFVERALAKDPARRYADAGEMAKALVELRDSLGGDTLGGAAAAERTLFQAGDETLLESPASLHASVRGATALTLARSPAAQSQLPRTVRPDPTLRGHAPAPDAGEGRSRYWLIGGGAAAALVLVAGGLYLLRGGSAPQALPTAEVEQQQLDILTEALVASQVELARADLANRDYAAAAERAQGVLKLHKGSVEAQEVRDQARRAQAELDAAAAQARAAFERKEYAAAAEALSRVMTLDPRHAVVGELSGELNRSFRRQAEDSRGQMEAARRSAEQARASSQSGFAEGRQFLTAAETSFKREEFTVAAQKYQQARLAFERARRESDEARAAAAAASAAAAAAAVRPLPTATTPHQPAVETPAQAVSARGGPSVPSSLAPSAAPSTSPVPAPTIAAALTPPPTTAPAPASSPYATLTPPPTAAAADSSIAAVRRVIEDYKRAIESQDLALYRRLKPDLSQDDEKKLRESFKVIKSWVIDINYGPIQVDGDHATAKVTRQDTINGRAMPTQAQTFNLARAGGAWQIRSMGQ